MRTALLIFCVLGFSARGATLTVTGSISQAIAAAHPGDTVLVPGPASYRERLIIDKPIRLLGTNAPVIDAGMAGTAVTIAAPGVEVSSLAIRNTGRDPGAYDAGVLISGPGAVVRECKIDSDGFGIYVRDANNCVIKNNTISGNAEVPSAKRGNGIHLWKTRGNRIENNLIQHKRDGMYLSYADETLIDGNRITDTRFGIHYMYSHQNQLVRNVLTGNSVGATLMFSRQSLVQSNTIVANRRHGMVLKQLDRSLILDNVVAGQNRGFFVQQATQNRFAGNLIATNDIGLYLSNCSEQNVFVGNAFIRNTDQVWQPPFETEQGRQGPNQFSERGRGNYWSDYAGTDRNQDGIGDTPYHETDVFGYIVDRHPQARVYAMSPALALLRRGEELLPLLDTVGVTDLAPLLKHTRNARITPAPQQSAALSPPAAQAN